MKTIPLPEGMIVHKKIHQGLNHYKVKTFAGIIHSYRDKENISVNVHQNKSISMVFASVYLDQLFYCGNCGGRIPWNAVMVMN
jgi:hypothetical protein